MKHVSLANLRLPSGVWCAMRLPLEGGGKEKERHARDDHVRCRFDRQELCNGEGKSNLKRSRKAATVAT